MVRKALKWMLCLWLLAGILPLAGTWTASVVSSWIASRPTASGSEDQRARGRARHRRAHRRPGGRAPGDRGAPGKRGSGARGPHTPFPLAAAADTCERRTVPRSGQPGHPRGDRNRIGPHDLRGRRGRRGQGGGRTPGARRALPSVDRRPRSGAGGPHGCVGAPMGGGPGDKRHGRPSPRAPGHPPRHDTNADHQVRDAPIGVAEVRRRREKSDPQARGGPGRVPEGATHPRGDASDRAGSPGPGPDRPAGR